MRQFSTLLILFFIVTLSACRSDFETVASNGKLEFSKDTVFLDTVFKNISSSTYQLKVYNKSNKDISIPTIQLEKGLNSKYRMNVDGMTGENGKLFSNITLLAKDSLYIFIETTADIVDTNPDDFLYTDKILFDSGSNQQKVELVTLIKDAIFLFPSKNANGSKETITINGETKEGFYLNENDPENGNELHFTNTKPYVIYGYAAVAENKSLTIDAGARVHFHANSGLYIGPKASLSINGTLSTTNDLENEVIFEGDRLEPDFNDIPGQWGSVWFASGSANHTINHLTLKNAQTGLFFENNNQVKIQNSQFYNCSLYGIQVQNSSLTLENSVINNSGIANLLCENGGDYQFTHCTFNNNWNSSTQKSVILSNVSQTTENQNQELKKATFNNCIIYGSYSEELLFVESPNTMFNYKFNNCLLKSNNKSYPSDEAHFENCIFNENPNFYNPSKNQLNIAPTSSAFANGNPNFIIPKDILGITRTSPPDLGAYQSQEFQDKKQSK